jgi:hypothetical protein
MKYSILTSFGLIIIVLFFKDLIPHEYLRNLYFKVILTTILSKEILINK